ncbi:hypothetical protein HN51_046256 [Arachis hypogaea]
MAQQVQELTVIAPDQNMVHYRVTRDTTVAIIIYLFRTICICGSRQQVNVLWFSSSRDASPRFVDNGDDADGDQKRAKVVFVHGGEAFKSVLLR